MEEKYISILKSPEDEKVAVKRDHLFKIAQQKAVLRKNKVENSRKFATLDAKVTTEVAEEDDFFAGDVPADHGPFKTEVDKHGNILRTKK